ncbi:hypothetical protein JCM15765_05070 [Paradesulfitobacterium aromaticivorans]
MKQHTSASGGGFSVVENLHKLPEGSMQIVLSSGICSQKCGCDLRAEVNAVSKMTTHCRDSKLLY